MEDVFKFKSNELVRHPNNEGVFLKHFFGREDNDQINNMEVHIVPSFRIAPHKHEESTEYYYVVDGTGEFGDGTEWLAVSKGDTFKAPKGMVHSIRNTGHQTLVLFSTFYPATR